MESFDKTDKDEVSVAVPAALNQQLLQHLLRDDEQEDATFALYYPSVGENRFTALVYKLILPEEGDREVHGNVEIYPQYFKRACRLAAQEKAGVVLLHSHLGPGWQNMSPDDIDTEEGYSPAALTFTDLPLVGMTLGTDGTWSARVWERQAAGYERKWAATVRVVGQQLHMSYADHLRPLPKLRNIYKRTATVWGPDNHRSLTRLRVGIVGLGSVGSMVAEALARMGMERFVLIDFDEVQEHNLDRLMGATVHDLGQPKAEVAARQIRHAATAQQVEIAVVPHGITEEAGYRAALDCDVLFSCVDRPWPRHVLNHIAYNHLIPVVDGGINVRFDEHKQFEGAEWQLQTVGPDRPCLQCLKAYDSADVATEQAGMLDDPSYLAGLPNTHRFKRNENIFPFSMNLASLEVLQFVEMVTGIAGNYYLGTQRYDYNHGFIRVHDNRTCLPDCEFTKGIALGDSVYPAPIGFDHSATDARKRQHIS
ncbi:molybdopterin/thiamine biosynthesis adenylyltransferase [Hymenobacter luteus]|uniref:Molybdopterin/thiamine biosynthesis adenylyltransferase n=2 Tax=Hymenobacter TaxID=89966 RepID=A0A7W9T5J0_9BACT|nr:MULTISPECIES: ThiF family adenylyltransferase [Hymenobacter]MBB4603473.1 molybdopterin/thiamine biosynthesis adenylyltransferase [Hymenobacter latericoloratus]MBB6061173.1 molybdopterin/thiamine biosynthesis adenylyltransferase [Hymenobacter luteus]